MRTVFGIAVFPTPTAVHRLLACVALACAPGCVVNPVPTPAKSESTTGSPTGGVGGTKIDENGQGAQDTAAVPSYDAGVAASDVTASLDLGPDLSLDTVAFFDDAADSNSAADSSAADTDPAPELPLAADASPVDAQQQDGAAALPDADG